MTPLVTVTPLHDGCAVQFPKDRALIARFRSRFPRARWGASTTSWHVPGKLATQRVALWAAEEEAAAIKARRAAENARMDALWEGRVEDEPRPAERRNGVALVSVPGSYQAGLPPPPGAGEAAVAAIAALGRQWQADHLLAFLAPPPVSAVWETQREVLRVNLSERGLPSGSWVWSLGSSPSRTVEWRWAVLRSGDGWQDLGWMPDHHWFGLYGEWRIRLWGALNPRESIIRTAA